MPTTSTQEQANTIIEKFVQDMSNLAKQATFETFNRALKSVQVGDDTIVDDGALRAPRAKKRKRMVRKPPRRDVKARVNPRSVVAVAKRTAAAKKLDQIDRQNGHNKLTPMIVKRALKQNDSMRAAARSLGVANSTIQKAVTRFKLGKLVN